MKLQKIKWWILGKLKGIKYYTYKKYQGTYSNEKCIDITYENLMEAIRKSNEMFNDSFNDRIYK